MEESASAGSPPTPADVKAEGIALLLQGYSSRKVEKRLRAKYPGTPVPSYVTLSRCLRRLGYDSGARMELLELAFLVCDVIEERLPKMTTDQVLSVYSRLSDNILTHLTQTNA